ncbi:MAG: DNA mismatch repair protein MutS [Deltaproteobacteria bacterium]|nr:DNA mismatch repair protein MutS [Deltaproteobacteria bacterium]
MTVLKTTPMIRQYLSIKADYKDEILLYRMGDFYEMFFEDAIIASKELEIALTARNKKSANHVPMCGVPIKAIDGYIAKLIAKGFKVAICDQIENPKDAKGIVKRKVTRVITPGMIIENSMLDEKTGNYILSLAQSDKTYGIASLDISTASFTITQADNQKAIIEEIFRISPAEILIQDALKNAPLTREISEHFSKKSITYIDNGITTYPKAKKSLLRKFKTISLEGFGCENLKAGVSAAGAIIDYVDKTQKKEILNLKSVKAYSLNNFMAIDNVSRRNLELTANIKNRDKFGTLISVIDQTITSIGARRLKNILKYPLINKEAIEKRLDAVAEAKDSLILRKSIRQNLKKICDLERLSSKICIGQSNARDLIALKNSLFAIPDIVADLKKFKSEMLSKTDMSDKIYNLALLINKSIADNPPPTINEGGIIKKGYDKQLDELIMISSEAKQWLVELEAKEKEKTKINSLKVGYNKIFGYYIEISKSNINKAPANYIRRQTLTNAERYITEELKEFETKALNASDQRASLEYEIFNRIKSKVIENNSDIQKLARFIGKIDCILSFAETAALSNYIKPNITEDGIIEIIEGRHPVIEKMLTNEAFVPNTIRLDNTDSQIIIVTGPNMAGKSTTLRQAALIVLMAHIGSFVPAKSASITITDKIFTRVGALDNLSAGQSTFMTEMEETANILNNSTENSLIIIDEIGRGTSTYDGLSIAKAVAEYLHDLKNKGVKTLFATHYHELIELEQTKPRIKNFNIAVKEYKDQIIFLRKLIKGGTNRSYGIQVARLAGIPDKIISRSKQILADIEKSAGNNVNNKESKKPNVDKIGKNYINIIDKIKNIEIQNLTPVEALTILDSIKSKLEHTEI